MICRKETGADVQSVTDKEILIMRNINHQNCVRLHNIYQTEEQVQLVMELLEGRDLFDRIMQRKKCAHTPQYNPTVGCTQVRRKHSKDNVMEYLLRRQAPSRQAHHPPGFEARKHPAGKRGQRHRSQGTRCGRRTAS